MNPNNSYQTIFNDYHPTLCLDKADISQLAAVYTQTNLLICGEVHGAKENADVFYTLVHHLSAQHVGIECNPRLQPFLGSVLSGTPDFSLVDPDAFQSSPLSIEMIKTIAVLAKEGVMRKITCLDTYDHEQDQTEVSPQEREASLAKTILTLDTTQPTICLMGQWHTIPTATHQVDSSRPHLSALYRVRQERSNTAFVHNLYRQGSIRNAGRVIELPFNQSLPMHYSIKSIGDYDFDLTIPEAHPITFVY